MQIPGAGNEAVCSVVQTCSIPMDSWSMSGISQASSLDLRVLFPIWRVFSFLSHVKKQIIANLFPFESSRLEIISMPIRDAGSFVDYFRAGWFEKSVDNWVI